MPCVRLWFKFNEGSTVPSSVVGTRRFKAHAALQMPHSNLFRDTMEELWRHTLSNDLRVFPDGTIMQCFSHKRSQPQIKRTEDRSEHVRDLRSDRMLPLKPRHTGPLFFGTTGLSDNAWLWWAHCKGSKKPRTRKYENQYPPGPWEEVLCMDRWFNPCILIHLSIQVDHQGAIQRDWPDPFSVSDAAFDVILYYLFLLYLLEWWNKLKECLTLKIKAGTMSAQKIRPLCGTR